MIFIISGEINSGKTTKILSLYNKTKCGDGFITPKLYYNNIHIGQRIIRLKTNEEKIFSIIDPFCLNNFKTIYKYENYSFNKEAFDFVYKNIDCSENPFYIDEIGPLELNNYGFHIMLINLLKDKNKDLYLAIRKNCLKKVLEKYCISDYNLI